MGAKGLTKAGIVGQNGGSPSSEWACGAAGSALPWHGRGHRFDPDQVHQITLYKMNSFSEAKRSLLWSVWCHLVSNFQTPLWTALRARLHALLRQLHPAELLPPSDVPFQETSATPVDRVDRRSNALGDLLHINVGGGRRPGVPHQPLNVLHCALFWASVAIVLRIT